ncbi:hypothetical protein [Cellulomonas oligotrophica]|uniref:Putative membrane protein n=1 Tax=Cellulomonas oligotrophica TaxID=931536 RepID=A0A7Y9FED4_9CELL|nr:hypothetical protein [Cellulomonas oligotrophica]NYD85679.1 putative membrane protein [Cellulomonas oligotrophica]GIG31313.1 hypothetical protein Col01nite_04720 [Cellulomonas oligotrophica]
MSTSDPQGPRTTTPDAAEPPTPHPAPDVEPAAEPAVDTGRHAVARPAPAPPEDVPADAHTGPALVPGTGPVPVVAAPAPAPAPAPSPAPAPPSAASPPVAPPAEPRPATGATAAVPRTVASPVEDPADELFPDPNAPRTPTWGAHVGGVLVALLITPFAIGLTLLGQSRILVVQAGTWDASLDVLGIVLVSIGLVLLCTLLALGLWTAAVPLTAGTVLTVTGAFALYAPGVARAQALEIVTSDAWTVTVTHVVVAGTSGTLLVAGALLLVAGLVTALARRRGVHLGVFRERNRHAGAHSVPHPSAPAGPHPEPGAASPA